MLADSTGKTLYSAAVEKGGIRCSAGCTALWDPVAATSADAKKAAGENGARLGVVKRQDAGAADAPGMPLYTFAEEGAGKLQGDGFADDFDGTHFEWQAARTVAGAGPTAAAMATE